MNNYNADYQKYEAERLKNAERSAQLIKQLVDKIFEGLDESESVK